MEARKLARPQPLPFELSLRIRHPSMDPAEVSRELGLEAEHSFRVGDPRRERGDATSPVHSESYWLGTMDPASWPADAWFSGLSKLDLAVKGLRKTVTRNLGLALSLSARRFLRAKGLFERIRLEGGQACLLVAFSPPAVESFSLTPELSRMFSDLGITLEFDLTSD